MNELTGSKGCLATDTRSLREIAPLLENYFGITLGYFTNEIESSTGISAAKAIQEEHEIRLPTNRFDYDAYMEQFGETPLLTDRLREALLFMAYIITDRKFNEEELYEHVYWEDWNIYKGEWAKLMLFMEETEQRHRNLYERVGEQEMPVTLRTNSRKQEPQTIPNPKGTRRLFPRHSDRRGSTAGIGTTQTVGRSQADEYALSDCRIRDLSDAP